MERRLGQIRSFVINVGKLAKQMYGKSLKDLESDPERPASMGIILFTRGDRDAAGWEGGIIWGIFPGRR